MFRNHFFAQVKRALPFAPAVGLGLFGYHAALATRREDREMLRQHPGAEVTYHFRPMGSYGGSFEREVKLLKR